MSTELKGGKPDLKKLAKAGRIKLAPDGEVEGQATNPVAYVDKRPVKVDGVTVAVKEIPVNGGHAKLEGSPWRVAIGSAAKWHAKVLADQKRKALRPDNFVSALPELTDEEIADYERFLSEQAAFTEGTVEITSPARRGRKPKTEEVVEDRA